MNSDTTVNNLHTIVVLVTAVAATFGLQLPSADLDAVGKGIVALIGVITVVSSWFTSHNHHAAPANGPLPAGAAPSASIAKVATMLLLGLVTAVCATGCAGVGRDTAHVYIFDATGNKLAVAQNPVTGLYELGWQRVQTEYTQIPVIFTNNEFFIPSMVKSYEANTHSAVFGNAAVTSTVATGGSNAVNTILGGQHQPINSGTGTSNNLVPVSH